MSRVAIARPSAASSARDRPPTATSGGQPSAGHLGESVERLTPPAWSGREPSEAQGEAGVDGVAVRALEAARSIERGGAGPRGVGEDDHRAQVASPSPFDELLDDLPTDAAASVLGSNRDPEEATTTIRL